MTPLARIVVGAAVWARYTEPADEGHVFMTGWMGMLADAGVAILLADDPHWPAEAVLAFGENGRVAAL